jgi:Transposase, Mutator family
VPEQPGLHAQRKTPLPLVQVRQQRREPIPELKGGRPWNRHSAPTSSAPKTNTLILYGSNRLRNLVAKLPDRPELPERVKSAYWQALDDAIDPADAEHRLRLLVSSLERDYPSAAACLAEDLPALCVHLKYFPRLRKRLRSSNLLERSLEEVRRRTKVIGRFPGETSCLSLCWAVLDLFIGGARGLGLTDLEYRQVVQLKLARAERDSDLAKIA